MARVWNPATQRYEDDGMPSVHPIIVETGADDPSTVSPPIVTSVEPAPPAPEPVMGTTAMGDVTGQPDEPIAPEPPPGPAPYGADKPTKFVEPFAVTSDEPAPEQAPAVATPSAPAPVTIGPTITTERTKVSAEAKAGQADQLAASKAGEGIAAREGAAKVDTAEAIRDLAANEAREKEIARREELEARAREQAKYQAGLAERDRILNDAEQQSHKDYWSDKPAGARLLSIFSSAIGEYAAVHSGTGHNGAQELLDKEFARDDAKKQNILKQAIYRAGLKGADAKEAYENGLMEISLRKSAVMDKLADTRAAVLASKGVPAAEVARDALVNTAQKESARLKTEFGEQLNVKVRSSNELQQKFKMESALEAQKAANGAGKEAGRGITDSRQRAQLAKGIKDQTAVANALKSKGVKLSEDDLQTMQDNRTYLDAVRHGDHGVASAMGTVLERKLGIVPRSVFDGLDSPEKKRLAGALDLMSQKAALLNAGAMTDESIRHSRDQNDLLTPGIGAEERARRWQYMQADLAGANQGMVPTTFAAAEKGAEAAGGALGTSRAAEPSSRVDIARLVAWARSNPDAPGARQALAKFGGQ